MAPVWMELLFKDMRTWSDDAQTVLQNEGQSEPRGIQTCEGKQLQGIKTKGAPESLL